MKIDILVAAQKAHPRLFAVADTAALQARIDGHEHLGMTYQLLRSQADALLDKEPLTRIQIGRRLLDVSRECLKRVLCLALLWRLSHERCYLERAKQELLAVAAFTDWNPSHFLDVAEMCAAVAIGYDWLFDELSAAEKGCLKQAMLEKALFPSLEEQYSGFVRLKNNWNQVCHAGMSLGALAIAEDEPQLAEQIVRRAVEHVPAAMHEYAPDGAYPEGPGYWKYGTTYNVMLIAALESAFATDFGLSDMPGFLASADYYRHVTGPDGLFFNYSDAGKSDGVSPPMYWFASKTGDKSLLWRELQTLRAWVNGDTQKNENDRFYALLFVWAPDDMTASEPAHTQWTGHGTTPVGLHRSSWSDPQASFVGIKGGTPNANHAHMDIGSFVFDALGERWIHDLGAESYHKLEELGMNLWGRAQDGDRWTVFRLNNKSHNTLVVNDALQRVSGFAPIIKSSVEADRSATIIDMTTVYADQLAHAQRGRALLADASILIQDEISAPADKPASIRWSMLTKAQVRMQGPRQAILEQNGKQVQVYLHSPATAVLETYDSATPAAAHDSENPGSTQIGFNIGLDAAAQAQLIIQILPVDSPVADTELRPLSEWS